MTPNIDDKLAKLATAGNALTFRRGIEREALRVDPHGNLARTPHPEAFGSKLCHPLITTDFSESQLELITPVSESIDDVLAKLDEIHRVVHAGLDDEILWSASMPCVLSGDDSIPLARYGSSNLGKLKTTYRNGLGHRYGRSMQTICAVHYNFSFNDVFWDALAKAEDGTANAEFRSRRYFDLMRNFRRFSWLPVYLFGASPAVCNSFVKGREHQLERFDEGSLYAPGATSLRSGNLGYQSDTQRGMINICYNSLDTYVSTLADAITTPFPGYEEIGLVRDGEHLQVNASILQSEAEFYTTIRAKCVPPKGENFLKILRRKGVEYVEVRLLDVNPYLPLGIDADEIRFLDTLLTWCVLIPSPEHDTLTCNAVTDNLQRVVWQGRAAGTTLDDRGDERSIADWGNEVLEAMRPVAAALDRYHGGTAYRDSLQHQADRLADPTKTPSAQILADMKQESIPFFRFAMNKALAHKAAFRDNPPSAETLLAYREMAETSVVDQRRIEETDTVDFDRYLADINRAYLEL